MLNILNFPLCKGPKSLFAKSNKNNEKKNKSQQNAPL